MYYNTLYKVFFSKNMAIKEEVGLIFFSRFLVFPVITVRGLLSARASLDRQHLATL